MKNVYVKSVVVLTVICLVISAILAVTNHFTAPLIEEQNARAAEKALSDALPSEAGFEPIEDDRLPATVTALYREKDGKGFVAMIAAKGYDASKPITAAVAVDTTGCVLDIVVISVAGETPGKGDVVATDSFLSPFTGKDASLEGVDTVSGATISTKPFIAAVRDALTACAPYLPKEVQ